MDYWLLIVLALLPESLPSKKKRRKRFQGLCPEENMFCHFCAVNINKVLLLFLWIHIEATKPFVKINHAKTVIKNNYLTIYVFCVKTLMEKKIQQYKTNIYLKVQLSKEKITQLHHAL